MSSSHRYIFLVVTYEPPLLTERSGTFQMTARLELAFMSEHQQIVRVAERNDLLKISSLYLCPYSLISHY